MLFQRDMLSLVNLGSRVLAVVGIGRIVQDTGQALGCPGPGEARSEADLKSAPGVPFLSREKGQFLASPCEAN